MGGLVPPTSTHSETTHSGTRRLLLAAIVYGSPLLIAAACMTACALRDLAWLLRALALAAALGPP